MSMKISNIKGWKDIYSFTLIQTIKNKTFLVSFIILIVLGLISMPLVNLITSSGDDFDSTKKNPIEQVYVLNESAVTDLDFSGVAEQETLKHIKFRSTDESYDDLLKRIDEKENTSVVLHITEESGVNYIELVRASKGDVSKAYLQMLGTEIQTCFELSKLEQSGITDEQYAMVKSEISTGVYQADEDGKEVVEEDTSISQNDYWFIYAVLFVVMMINVMSGSQVATSIVSDKSSKVVETLLISVKPLAIIVGKVLAMLTAVIGQMVCLIVVIVISAVCNTKVVAGGMLGETVSGVDTTTMLSQYLNANILHNFNFINIILCLIVIGLGLILYGTFAGLAGATVSRLEEASEGLTLFSFVNIIGAYIGMGAASSLVEVGENAFVTFALICPISSPFILPGAVLLGKCNVGLIAIAILCQVIFISLLFRFVARVYEVLILHNGNRIGLKELFALSKSMKKNQKSVKIAQK